MTTAVNQEGGAKRPRILYLHGTVVPPATSPQRNNFHWLSAHLEGAVLQQVWFKSPEEWEQALGLAPGEHFRMDGFTYRFCQGFGNRDPLQKLKQAWFFLRTGWQLHRQQKFDCIVTYAHTLTGFCGVLLKWLTGAPLIIGIMGYPPGAYVCLRPKPTLLERLLQVSNDVLLHISVGLANHVHLIASGLLDDYPLLRNRPRSIFADFVAASAVAAGNPAESETVLLVGAPWYLKGADVLVKAFRRLEADFPRARLRLLGHFPDAGPLREMVGDCSRIEIMKSVSNAEALKIISAAAVLVLPSRTEGMGRVLLEAMLAGVPVVGSRIGGIPSVIHEGENGFLFPVADVDQLEAILRRLLADPELRVRLGQRGREMAADLFTQERYAENFARMVHTVIAPDGKGALGP